MLFRTIARAAVFMAAGVQVARGQTATATATGASSNASADASTTITSGSSTATQTSTTSSGPTTHTVRVGSGGFTYIPDVVNASVGDTVAFQFYPTNHSVIRAAFGYPCIPYEYVTTDGYPFYSGMQEVTVVGDAPSFFIKINDTQPIFYYCGAPDSCEGHGMIGVINPNKTQNLQEQKDARSTETFALTPGQPWPTEGNSMTSITGLAITATASGGSGSSSSGSGSGSGSGSSGSSGLSSGAIAGIAVGAAAILVIAGGLLWFCGRKGGVEKGYRKSGMTTAGPFTGAGGLTDVKYAAASPGSPDLQNFGTGTYGPTPISPGVQSMGSGHGPFPSPGLTTPMMSQDYYTGHPTMASMPSPPPGMTQFAPPVVPSVQQSALVELPASVDPGNSPLPQYSQPNQPSRTYSWGPNAEAGYRPSDKPA